MNASAKNVLLIIAKNAVNALLTSSAMTVLWPTLFTIHTGAGWLNLLKVAGTTVVAREVAVWLPIVLSWSTTNADPGVQVVRANTQTVIQPKP